MSGIRESRKLEFAQSVNQLTGIYLEDMARDRRDATHDVSGK